MDEQTQTGQQDGTRAQKNQPAPSGTSENKGNRQPPAGGTANAPGDNVAQDAAAPTLAEHVQATADAIDVQISALSDKQAAIDANASQGLLVSTVAMNKVQSSILSSEIAWLSEKKAEILAILENIPEELHSLEARAFAAFKHLF